MTSTMLVTPSGTTRMKKKVTIHGIVRQRVRPHLRDFRCQHADGAVAEKRLPHAIDISELIRGEIPGEQPADERQGDHRRPLMPGRWVVGPTWWDFGARLH